MSSSTLDTLHSALPSSTLGRSSVLGGLLRAMQRCLLLLTGALGVQKSRRLRVTETVSLGEKRFLSIVTLDGSEYLIGGGSTAVSLLKELSPTERSPKPDFASAIGNAWTGEEAV